jgi:hypothetical protein
VEHTFLRLQLEVHTSDHHVAEASNTFAAAAYVVVVVVVVVVGGDVVVAVVDEISEEVGTAQELDRVVYVTCCINRQKAK